MDEYIIEKLIDSQFNVSVDKTISSGQYEYKFLVHKVQDNPDLTDIIIGISPDGGVEEMKFSDCFIADYQHKDAVMDFVDQERVKLKLKMFIGVD